MIFHITHRSRSFGRNYRLSYNWSRRVQHSMKDFVIHPKLGIGIQFNSFGVAWTNERPITGAQRSDLLEQGRLLHDGGHLEDVQ